MTSPFPGVDPYIEGQGRWQDFHSRFINSWCEAVSDQLPPDYQASIDERVEIREIDTERDRRLVLPDVAITRGETASQHKASPKQESGIGMLEAVTLELPAIEEVRTRRIQILHQPEKALVGVLELLSPTNKNHPGRGQYLARRADLLMQDVHLVELDLLLGGRRMPMSEALPAGDFFAIVARSDRRPKAEVYAWSLRDPLPRIAIPLLKPDKDIFVDLNLAFATAYDRAKYWKLIQYRVQPELDLEELQMRWVLNTANRAT